MSNQLFFSSGATSLKPDEQNTGGAIQVATSNLKSIRDLAEQKLNELGCYIRSAYEVADEEEDDRWKSSKEPR